MPRGHYNRKTRPEKVARFREVLMLVCRGKTDAEIGELLNLSITSIYQVVNLLLDAFGAENRVGLAVSAIRQGFITLDTLEVSLCPVKPSTASSLLSWPSSESSPSSLDLERESEGSKIA